MGFFDKLKQAKNFITGGGAVVNIRTGESICDGNSPIKFFIEVVVKDADVNMNNLYLKVRALEEVTVRDTDHRENEEGEHVTESELVTNSHETFSSEVQVTGAETLEANKTYNWEYEFELPQNVYGTYRGHNAVHIWEVYAGVDMSGNDPDSGWITFEVKK